jgi:hypothetical protein
MVRAFQAILPLAMQLDLTDEAAALLRLLNRAIEYDRYPLSPRIQTLRGILAKFRSQGTGSTVTRKAANAGGAGPEPAASLSITPS